MKKNFVIIFDLDGTLLNTDLLIYKSFEHVFEHYFPDYQLSDEELLSFLGPSLRASFARYVRADKIDEMIDYFRAYNHTHQKEYVTIYPHIKETLDKLKSLGYPMTIVTTKNQEAAYIGLDLFDITKYFDFVLGCDEVEKGKPEPDGLLKAMELTHCSKGVMIGDNSSDIKAGKNAGLYTIGVKWSPKGYQQLAALKPDLLIDDMSEIVEFIEGVSEK